LRRLAASLACALALTAPVAVTEAAPSTTCTGGTIAAGTYPSLTITGTCSLANSGTVTVNGNLTVASGGVLNARTLANLKVNGNLVVSPNGAALVGCSPAIECSGTTTDVITGSVSATQAQAFIMHSTTVSSGVTIAGSTGGVSCAPSAALAPVAPFPGAPNYFDVEDSQIGGQLSISNLQACWLGTIRDHVNASVSIANNTLADPDAVEVVTNTISGNLSCSGNSPHAQVGDSGGQPNSVGGSKQGECARL
jgi:hypothetical protein